MAEIKVENLKYRYPDTEKLALDGITCDIKPGEFIGVIGRNGSGKAHFVRRFSGLCRTFTVAHMVERYSLMMLK